jgi:putative membrane protein
MRVPLAEEGDANMIDWGRELFLFGASIVYAVVGGALLLIAYEVFDKATPHNLDTVIFQDKNLAAAVVLAAFLIALAIIIHAAIQ